MQSKPILVTGINRSGSTWTGRMLAISPTVYYIHEVFNLTKSVLGNHQRAIRYWFEYPTAANKPVLEQAIQDVLQFKHPQPQRVPTHIKRWLLRTSRTVRGYPRPLIKDPIAALSSEWMAHQFDMAVVVIWRHPAAFVSSVLRKGWHLDLRQLLEQEDLMRDWLYPFASQMQSISDHTTRAATQWLCIYTVLHGYIQRNPNWLVRRHEDLAHDPVTQFQTLYAKLHIPFTSRIAQRIQQHSADKNPILSTDDTQYLIHRNSQALIKHWHNDLSPAQIDTIRSITAPLADLYYGDEDW